MDFFFDYSLAVCGGKMTLIRLTFLKELMELPFLLNLIFSSSFLGLVLK